MALAFLIVLLPSRDIMKERCGLDDLLVCFGMLLALDNVPDDDLLRYLVRLYTVYFETDGVEGFTQILCRDALEVDPFV